MNRKIKLDDAYYIDIDDRNWTLKKLVPVADRKKDGNPSKNAGRLREMVIGYYPRLDIALKHYTDNWEKDEISRAAGPVDVSALQTILTSIEKACMALKLVED